MFPSATWERGKNRTASLRLIEKDDAGYRAQLTSIDEAHLPSGDVDVRVSYSTINYKDALAITGNGPVVRQFPMVPGIELVGVVESSSHKDYAPGDVVLLNGRGVGEQRWGGLAQKARLNGDWLIPLPDGIFPRQSMAIGTAGYTAMLSILALERHGVTPDSGDILVTGANSGVGSFAITLLSRLGYRVVASTGRLEEADFLRGLGAAGIIDRRIVVRAGQAITERTLGGRDRFCRKPHAGKCLCKHLRRWRRRRLWSCSGMDFPATVAPFILRGVSLLGINSVTRPKAERIEAWNRLSRDLKLDDLETISHEIGLADVIPAAGELLAGRVRGRLVVDVNR